MRFPGERSTSEKKGTTLETDLSHSSICQLEKQTEEIEKPWVEEGGKPAVSCLGSQVREGFRKGEVSCVEAEDQVLVIEVQQCNTIQLLLLHLLENNEDHSI